MILHVLGKTELATVRIRIRIFSLLDSSTLGKSQNPVSQHQAMRISLWYHLPDGSVVSWMACDTANPSALRAFTWKSYLVYGDNPDTLWFWDSPILIVVKDFSWQVWVKGCSERGHEARNWNSKLKLYRNKAYLEQWIYLTIIGGLFSVCCTGTLLIHGDHGRLQRPVSQRLT